MPVAEIHVSDLRERLTPLGATDVRPLAGGASSLTFAATVAGGRRAVVKVAPPGVPPTRNRDVLRQARILRVLDGGPVPVPEVLWEDGGDPPDVPPLFVMAFVAGTSLEPLFDEGGEGGGPSEGGGPGADTDPDVVAARLRTAARVLARLHALDPDRLGLADEPRTGLAGEVDRWSRLLETVDPTLAPGWRDVAAALRATAVTPVPDAVVHGDFRLGNLLAAGAEVRAVVDWEIWSVGDPRIDLGWFLANADPATYRRATRYAATTPPVPELAATYQDERGQREVPDRTTFQALACFKSAATWALIVKHNRRRPEPDPALERMAPALPGLLARATELLR
jgi:aminoglycoside phosphotransferase (APT) family kinase protein